MAWIVIFPARGFDVIHRVSVNRIAIGYISTMATW
jgi:hypothetical protein